MNTLAVVHRGRDGDCFPLDPCTFRIRISVARDDFDRIELCYAMNKYRWDQERKTVPLIKVNTDRERDYYQADISGRDTRLAYIFLLYQGEDLFFFSEEGLSRQYAFEYGHYTYFQYPFIHACDVHRVVSWADTAVMYQIFPERFACGLGGKDYVNTPWDARPAPKSFYGGDLAGIEQHLGYLQDLGVNCVYLTPVHPSPSNHKYDVTDYETVDAAFGGEIAFRSLIKAVHSRGMRLMLDGVFNHCSERFGPFQDVLCKGKDSVYRHWFLIDGECINQARTNYRMFGSVPYMPKLNTGHPEVIEHFCAIGARWVRDYHIDGWRLDVMDEISDAFIRSFRVAVKRENPDALILGEAWHQSGHWLKGDQLDGVMNYALTKALMDCLANRTLDAQGLAERLIRIQAGIPPNSARMMMNLIGSHDTHRFLTLVKGDKRLMKLALCILFFYVGIPCVYYGDEVGMEGGYDPDCRRGFPWDERRWDHSLRALVQTLCRLRTDGCLAGDEISIRADGHILRITRPRARLLLNLSDYPESFAADGETDRMDAWEYRIKA